MSLLVIKDLRAVLGPVRHQGRRPTCLSFATSDAHRHARQHPEPLSVEWLYCHASQLAGTGLHEGTAMPDTRTVLKSIGQPVETVWPYSKLTPNPATWQPPLTSEVSMKCGSTVCGTGLSGVRQGIDDDLPVVIGLFTSATFDERKT